MHVQIVVEKWDTDNTTTCMFKVSPHSPKLMSIKLIVKFLNEKFPQQGRSCWWKIRKASSANNTRLPNFIPVVHGNDCIQPTLSKCLNNPRNPLLEQQQWHNEKQSTYTKQKVENGS
jgi:hypothetical protein